MKNKLVITKIGGKFIDDKAKLDSFITEFSQIKGPKILIHGGGNKATEISVKLGLEPKLIEGRRITSKDDLDVVVMVYSGLINKSIVAKLQAKNCNSIGLSGADGNTITAVKRPATDIDYGFVGDVATINTNSIEQLLNAGFTPVFSAICHDGNGQLFNTNADTITSELAIAMSDKYDVKLVYHFEKDGVLDADDNIISSLNMQEYSNLRSNNVIKDGMIPKVDNCFNALKNNVSNVCIGNTKIV